jgi:hypothetical protein
MCKGIFRQDCENFPSPLQNFSSGKLRRYSDKDYELVYTPERTTDVFLTVVQCFGTVSFPLSRRTRHISCYDEAAP